MKKVALTILVVLSHLLTFSQIPKQTIAKSNVSKSSSNVKKKNNGKIKPTVIVGTVKLHSKQTYEYYALSGKKQTVLNVNGPGKLEVLLRVRLEDTLKSSKPYYLTYTIDNKKVQTVKVGSEKASKKTKYKSKLTGVPSTASTVTINIPPGKHKISFVKDKTDQKIHAHFSIKKDKDPKWVECPSIAKLDTVKVKYLEESNKIKKFVRISDSKKFTCSIKDSSQLKIVIKAELGNTTQSNAPIRLVMKENGKVINTYRIEGKKSTTTEYVDEKKLIPGNSNVIYVTVPSGEHSYEFFIEDKNKTALILIYSNKLIKKINKNL